MRISPDAPDLPVQLFGAGDGVLWVDLGGQRVGEEVGVF